jgi:hypothetical protein
MAHGTLPCRRTARLSAWLHLDRSLLHNTRPPKRFVFFWCYWVLSKIRVLGPFQNLFFFFRFRGVSGEKRFFGVLYLNWVTSTRPDR